MNEVQMCRGRLNIWHIRSLSESISIKYLASVKSRVGIREV